MRERTVKCFAYGSLRQGGMRESAMTRFEATAEPAILLDHTLHAWGLPYPVVVPNEHLVWGRDGAVVVGDLWSVPFVHATKALREWDRIEGYYPGRQGGNLYERRVGTVLVGDQFVRAWVYTAHEGWRSHLSAHSVVDSGDWLDVVAAREEV